MKYSIEGFSQERLVQNGLDPIDAILLRWFVDFYASGAMSTVTNEDGVPFGWVKYSKVIEELPCLGLKTPDSVSRRFKKLVDCGVLDHYHHLVGGSFSTYKPSKKLATFTSSTPLDQKSEGTDEKSDPYGSKVGPPPDQKSEQKTLLPNNPSIKDKETRHRHGEYNHVLLTSSELDRLKEDFPLDWEERIARLDEYIQMKGASYKDHNLTIRNWARKDRSKEPEILTDEQRREMIAQSRRNLGIA
jgi:hypothetical protein